VLRFITFLFAFQQSKTQRQYFSKTIEGNSESENEDESFLLLRKETDKVTQITFGWLAFMIHFEYMSQFPTCESLLIKVAQN